ncbi:MAG: hypothetical protein AMJ63_09385 [Myxococcales bacterium SG8_38_1]|jgi:hypothetical protein|nr:MAG: hypothetical protein AMJ63_09385 [Myxococcales bacterium SG8_38_1]
MFPNAHQSAVAHDLLVEVASSTAFQHATLWAYSALGVFALTCLLAGYVMARVVDRADAGSRASAPLA